jgi:hypothetical protein
MRPLSPGERLDVGMRAANSVMVKHDKIWARYSGDKVDVGHGLADVIRNLVRGLAACRPLRALSVGASSEPQFRILEPMFRGGLYLVDIEQAAIDIILERNKRQEIEHVHTVQGDYLSLLGNEEATKRFTREVLGGQRVDLVTFHHSMYYAPRAAWTDLVASIYSQVLAQGESEGDETGGAIHAVMASNREDDPRSANWLYNYFARKHFGVRNTQDLPDFAVELRNDERFASGSIRTWSSKVSFWSDDFENIMHGVWMILLHPNVHQFDEVQQQDVIEYVYESIYAARQPLTQWQDHLCIHARGAIAGGPELH